MKVVSITTDRANYGQSITGGLLDYAQRHRQWRVEVDPNIHHVLDRVRRNKLAGVLAMIREDRLDEFSKLPIPVVNLSSRAASDLPGPPQIINDDLAVGTLAAEHLLSRGYRRFAYLGEDLHLSRQRRRGLLQAIQAEGAELIDLDYRGPHDPGVRSIHTQRAHFRQGVKTIKPPFAIFAVNDGRARRVIDWCQELGLRVPEQVAVIGVDNDELVCRMTWPELSSVRTDARRIGYEAGALLDRMMQGKPAPEKPTLIPPLGIAERRSTDAYAVSDPRLAEMLRHIQERVAQGLQVQDLCKRFKTNRRTIELRFARHVGRTPLQEIHRSRVEMAKRLLVDADDAMPVIAAASGFPDPKVLARVFKKVEGVTPSAYRKRYR